MAFDRTWADRIENYADGYLLAVAGTTATGAHGTDLKQPMVVYSVTLTLNASLGSGDVSLVDGSATGDAGDTRRFRAVVASAAGASFSAHYMFPRGMVFDTGLLVSATTVTGAVTLTYKMRY